MGSLCSTGFLGVHQCFKYLLVLCFLRIPTLQPLAMLTCLEVLTASNNFLKDLSGVQSMERLRKIDVSSNQIHNLEDIHHAQKAKYLDEICTQNNPLEKVGSMRQELHLDLNCGLKACYATPFRYHTSG